MGKPQKPTKRISILISKTALNAKRSRNFDYWYIGKTFHEGEWKVGKVNPPPFSFKGIYVWMSDGKSFKLMEFFLKYNYTIAAEDVQDFYWRDYIPDYISHDTLEAAKGRYIGQTSPTGITPGTIYPYKNVLILGENGKKTHKVNVKILCTNNPERFHWEKINFNGPIGNQMDNAVKGGYHTWISDYWYIGKTFHEGEWKVGKVF